MTEWVGKTLSKVTIERPLARGGMAEVFLGRHQTLDIPVAVKILHAHLSEDSQLQARLQAEARAVAALRHPNIVQVYDLDVADGRPYIVMELIEGPSLAQYLASLHKLGMILPLETIGRLLTGLCSALDYAHARGIVHRDIKPANVILRRSGGSVRPGMPLPPDVEPVLTDFGIARIAGGGGQTASGTIMGTPAYMSPEQVRGERVDSACDIYALGVMLYEMLAGRLPFTADEDTPVAMVYKHLNEPVPPIPNTPAEMQAVVDRAMAKGAADRFPSASALESAFIEALPGSERATLIAARRTPVSLEAPPSRGRSRRGILLGFGAVAVVGLLVAGVFGARSLLSGSSEPTPSVQVSPAPETPATPADAAASPTAEPPQAPIPADGSLAVLSDTALRVRLVGLPPTETGLTYFAWLTSADGATIPAGVLEPGEDGFRLDYAPAEGEAEPTDFSAAEIWLGPEQPSSQPQGSRLLQLTLSEADGLQLAQLAELGSGLPPIQAVLETAPMQAGHYDSHLRFAVEGLQAGDLAAAKRHAEHLINIVDGADGEAYGDWNDDGRTENPGDDFGLLPYLSLLRSLLLPPTEDEELSEAERSAAGEARAEAERLAALAAQARDLAERIASADTAEEAQALGEQLSGMLAAEQVLAIVEIAAGMPLGLQLDIQPAAP